MSEKPPAKPRKKKAVAAEKETSAKPKGPLIISVSIQNQKVRIYDANGFFAESPISTGVSCCCPLVSTVTVCRLPTVVTAAEFT